ncbi:TetR/AcrR family transcriptional regulator [Hydrocarboniclastica marina]|uniref:TetR/AcrR family transcriptional regulator n=1 Tax=Hydrocarboniclastica marina TaxID=2259620 RepID=A0A4P7XMW0_9ALTE|nr:TetR/AcrR family transcriptional regulator [Hydrocarboniclastica marina]QCF27992.1 TetR/AcrR family transcriptional regulator [Hydrocarboniclastica marina]
MKTRDKIILASLELFNRSGERNVTTNHIAAHMGISPGNLYYHFRNKSEIVYEIFRGYRQQVEVTLQLNPEVPFTVQEKLRLLETVFDGLWEFRFFHRDLEFLLDADERLRRDYREFTHGCLSKMEQILLALQHAGIFLPHEDSERQAMALNTWLIVTNWMSFLKTAHAGEGEEAITRQQLRQGIYQVLTLELPYVSSAYHDEIERLRKSYRFEVSLQSAC